MITGGNHPSPMIAALHICSRIVPARDEPTWPPRFPIGEIAGHARRFLYHGGSISLPRSAHMGSDSCDTESAFAPAMQRCSMRPALEAVGQHSVPADNGQALQRGEGSRGAYRQGRIRWPCTHDAHREYKQGAGEPRSLCTSGDCPHGRDGHMAGKKLRKQLHRH